MKQNWSGQWGSLYQELKNIVVKHSKKIVLMTEHSASNEINLENLSKSKDLPSHETWFVKGRKDAYGPNKNMPIITLENFQMGFNPIINEHIHIDLNKNSHLQITNLIAKEAWIVAPILCMHIGVPFKNKFGGFEHSLETSKVWNEHWKEIRFLEAHQPILDFAKEHANATYEEDLGWINNSLQLSRIYFNYGKDNNVTTLYENDIKEQINHYNWNFLNAKIKDESDIRRNKLWVEKMKQELKGEDNVFLIVVGTGHLMGIENFLILLRKEILPDIKTLTRFSEQERKWRK